MNKVRNKLESVKAVEQVAKQFSIGIVSMGEKIWNVKSHTAQCQTFVLKATSSHSFLYSKHKQIGYIYVQLCVFCCIISLYLFLN
jgi:hypothetical protein